MQKKKLTKWSLIWRSARQLVRVFSLQTGLMLIFFTILDLIRHTPFLTALSLNGFFILFMFLATALISLSCFVKGLRLLHRQERLFGFRFSGEELDPEQPDSRWFICTDGTFLAFRRGFLQKADKIHRINYSRGEVHVWDCEGKRHRLACDWRKLQALKQWIEQDDHG